MTDKMPCHISDEWVYNPDEDSATWVPVYSDEEDDKIVLNGEEE